MASIDIALLGGFVATVDGEPVPDDRWSRRAAASLVKLLALAPDRSLHRERVIDALWPDDTLDRAAPKLHKAAHYVRRAPSSSWTAASARRPPQWSKTSSAPTASSSTALWETRPCSA